MASAISTLFAEAKRRNVLFTKNKPKASNPKRIASAPNTIS